jgi:hypothetical protein
MHAMGVSRLAVLGALITTGVSANAVIPLVAQQEMTTMMNSALNYQFFLNNVTLVLFLVGVFQDKPFLVLEFNFIVKIILALFLIYRFNSFRKNKIEFTELDRQVAFSAGIYILMISFIDYFFFYIKEIRISFLSYISRLYNYTK